MTSQPDEQFSYKRLNEQVNIKLCNAKHRNLIISSLQMYIQMYMQIISHLA